MLLKKIKVVKLTSVSKIVIMKRYSNFDLPPNECELCMFRNYSSNSCKRINCCDYDNYTLYTYIPHKYIIQ